MGDDLRLLVPLHPHAACWLIQADLDLTRRYGLFELVRALPSHPAPAVFCNHAERPDGKRGFGEAHIDAQGQELRWVAAEALAPLGEHEELRNAWANRSAFAYIRALPPDWPVVLYWH